MIYLRGHEGRGIGLINKLKAYRLQEEGLDTLDANLALGLPADARDYGAADGILEDLGISSVRAADQQPREGCASCASAASRSPSWCRSWSASASTTRATSRPSATGWATCCPTHEALDARIDDALEAQERSSAMSGEGLPDSRHRRHRD